jgi:hypothetical protein
LSNQRGNRTRSERQTDLRLWPPQFGKIKGNESTKPRLNIGQKEIQPVESSSTLL